ncbi:hypothetical protein [Streptomyces sp. P3]|uniref:hypothetical protein n=1 Tax=Streptomyces sp. P3 TaxID=2135430 RepID=UPI00131F2055|nr:hypothetical protein [Streptomyces sp. P3]
MTAPTGIPKLLADIADIAERVVLTYVEVFLASSSRPARPTSSPCPRFSPRQSP